MTIAGRNTIQITDILVGDVWLGSGQSNMGFVVSGDMAKYPRMAQRFAGVVNETQEIAAANYSKIREFRVPLKTSELPMEDVAGRWQVCTPATMPGFSAIGYFFSRDLQRVINQPVGFITSAFGASCAQAWHRWPEGANLYNTEGLPAPQFRSDDWVASTPAGRTQRTTSTSGRMPERM
jgi:sialate O-acetylesterase